METRGVKIDWLVPIYDAWDEFLGVGKSLLKDACGLIELKEGERLLDVGCGTGELLSMLKSKPGEKAKLVGIDPSKKMLKKARKKAKEADFKEAVIEKIPYPKNHFDIVVSSFLFHHLPNDLKIKGLKEIRRVLKPKGKMIIIDVGTPKTLFAKIMSKFVSHLVFFEYFKYNHEGIVAKLVAQAKFKNIKTVKTREGLLGTVHFLEAYK